MNNKKAYLFDLNGTMIDDMQYHIKAWHRILNELGADISMERVKEECYGKNNELLERTFPGRFTDAEKDHMILKKEKQYQKDYHPQLKLIDGLDNFLKEADKQNIPMAIGSAAIMLNIDFVLDGLNIREYFKALLSADNVGNSKPNLERLLKCAVQLNVLLADCIVFEHSPKDVEAVHYAGMQAAVINTMQKEEEFIVFPNVIGSI